jgi:hypothetical protein
MTMKKRSGFSTPAQNTTTTTDEFFFYKNKVPLL